MFAHTPAPDQPALLHSYVQRAGAFQPPHVGAEPDGSTAVTAMMARPQHTGQMPHTH
ncbi:hypothetical protein [Komagataeibacter medellinensis]|uniref:hypothetical protein n=1 Tax=Komagataeibacter medellinensis TaxID=1177712 RepID=UPI0012950F09|nr:hypothetical protein [Komagataeibacter medellinensis]